MCRFYNLDRTGRPGRDQERRDYLGGDTCHNGNVSVLRRFAVGVNSREAQMVSERFGGVSGCRRGLSGGMFVPVVLLSVMGELEVRVAMCDGLAGYPEVSDESEEKP